MKKKSNALDALVNCLAVFNEYSYEDSEISEEEFEIAKKRFYTALKYIMLEIKEDENALGSMV